MLISRSGSLLDTVAVSAFHDNHPALIALMQDRVNVYGPAIVIGEMYQFWTHTSQSSAC